MGIFDSADLGRAVGAGGEVGASILLVFSKGKQQQHLGAANNIGIIVSTGVHSNSK